MEGFVGRTPSRDGVRLKRYLLLATLAALVLAVPLLVGGAKGTKEYRDTERQFWSLQKRTEPEVPQLRERDAAWVRNPIDAFVLAKLRENGLQPAPEADRATLIRRLSFDLLGLPPDPGDVADFLTDKSPDAYERLVDRTLKSPHYGERWAQHWLDVVRFAETEGFEYDRSMQGSWRYRDYVIQAFNHDKPYDRFVLEQLAGDEIGPDSQETQIAVGLHRLGPVRRNAGNQEVASSRNEVLTERTDMVGAAFLGLTVGCARCHDHMFDPIRQRDYYRLQAFLAGTARAPDHPGAARGARRLAGQDRRDQGRGQEAQGIARGPRARGERNASRKKSTRGSKNSKQNFPSLCRRLRPSATTQRNGRRFTSFNGATTTTKASKWACDSQGCSCPTERQRCLPTLRIPRRSWRNGSPSRDHPLTARVMANRLWTWHFGNGIVNTPNDFGFNGERPSHPELLDYLANEFVESGWSVKALHRKILLSSTYRQSSHSSVARQATAKDPENRLLWRFSRRRLEAEEIRDAMLAVSGKVNRKAGGESVIVPVEEELVKLLYKPSQWKVAQDPTEHFRRSVYLIAKRNLRLPFMEVFDQPALLTTCARREASTHAPQALELLNGRLSNQLAGHLAERLQREVGGDRTQQVERAYLLAAGRAPTQDELRLGVQFLAHQPLKEFALTVFNLNAFLYVN